MKLTWIIGEDKGLYLYEANKLSYKNANLEYYEYYVLEITDIIRDLLKNVNKPKRFKLSKFYKLSKFIHIVNNSKDEFIY